MVIQTNDGQVFENEFDMINKRIFDPHTAAPQPPSIDDQFDKLSTDPSFNIEMDPNGNPIQPIEPPKKPHSGLDGVQFTENVPSGNTSQVFAPTQDVVDAQKQYRENPSLETFDNLQRAINKQTHK